MIVRLMGEGQYRLDDAVATQLNGLDDDAVAALERDDEVELDRCLDAMWRMVRAQGAELPPRSSPPPTSSSRRAI